MEKRKVLAVSVGVLAGCFILQSSAFADEGKTTVKVVQFKTELSEQMNDMAEAYMEEHPDVDLQIESIISEDYDTVLKTRFANGEAPDIFSNQGYQNMTLWSEYLEDLSDQPWVDEMVDTSKEGISMDGKIYGLPLYIEGYGFLYNKDYFEQAGITEVPTTLDEFKEVVQKLEDAGISPISVNGAEWYPNGLFLANIPVASQDDPNKFLEDLNNGTETFRDNQLFYDWLDLVDVMKEHAVTDPLSVDFSGVVSDFATGKVAMIMGLNGYQPMIDDVAPDMNVGIMPMPINNDSEMNDKIYASVSTYWCVNKESKSKEAAKEFLNWLVSSETGQRYITEEFGFIPGLKNITPSAEQVGEIGAEIQEYSNAGKAAGWEFQKYPDGVTTEFGNGVQMYYAGELDKDGLLDYFQQCWDELKTE